MVVLIVTKTTNYELHGAVIEAKVAQGRVHPDALVRLKVAHDDHYATLANLHQALIANKLAWDQVSRDFPRPWSKAYDLVLTVGGDGTLLAATHQMAAGGLVAGIRSSLSSVGFLCCASPAEVTDLVRAIADGKIKAAAAHRVKAQITRSDGGGSFETEPVLNDFLYANASPAATTRYQVELNGVFETHRSSGLWVATATGSTAAILAAGGDRRPAGEALFQYRFRELYKLGLAVPEIEGGLFDPDRELLEIENRCPNAILATDGQHGCIELGYGDMVRFLRAPAIQLVRSYDR
jgi:NAD+ kinase